jgi:hypothetical protein
MSETIEQKGGRPPRRPRGENAFRAFQVFAAICTATLCACQDIEQPDLLPALLLGSGSGRIGVVSSDLGGAGRFTTLSAEGVPQISFTSIHGDATARYQDGRVYIVNRLGRDNIQVLNPAVFYLTELEFSTEAGSNPHDIALVGPGKAFITRYERSTLWLANPATGQFLALIDLAAFADADGIPEMSGLFAHDGSVYVAVQRLDRNSVLATFPPTDYSALIEIDGTTGSVVAEHRLPLKNPFGKLRSVTIFGQPHLIVATPGGIGAAYGLDGGVAAFNLITKSYRPGNLYTEVAAGGDILDVVVKNDTVGYASVLNHDLSTAVQRFDPSTGARVVQLAYYPASAGFVAGMLLAPDGRLYVADARSGQSGVAIYDTGQGDRLLTPMPIDVGLQPTDLVYVP